MTCQNTFPVSWPLQRSPDQHSPRVRHQNLWQRRCWNDVIHRPTQATRLFSFIGQLYVHAALCMPAQAIVVTRLSLILPRSLPTAAVTQAKQVSFSCGFVLFFRYPGFLCAKFSLHLTLWVPVFLERMHFLCFICHFYYEMHMHCLQCACMASLSGYHTDMYWCEKCRGWGWNRMSLFTLFSLCIHVSLSVNGCFWRCYGWIESSEQLRQQGHAGSETLHQQNPPFLNWRCRLMQVDLYIGHVWWLLWLPHTALLFWQDRQLWLWMASVQAGAGSVAQ